MRLPVEEAAYSLHLRVMGRKSAERGPSVAKTVDVVLELLDSEPAGQL